MNTPLGGVKSLDQFGIVWSEVDSAAFPGRETRGITLSWRKCDNPSSLESGVKGRMILFEVFVVVLWLSHVQLFATPWTEPARLPCTWDSPGKNTGVSCHFLLQGIFLTQRSNLCLQHLLHCRQSFVFFFFFFFLPLSYWRSPGLFWSIWIQCRFCPFCVNVSWGWSPGSVPFGGMQVVWK